MCGYRRCQEGGRGLEEVSLSGFSIDVLRCVHQLTCDRAHPYEEVAYHVLKVEDL